MTIGITNNSPMGIPTRNWRTSFFRRSRLFSQYRIKSLSCCVSIVQIWTAKIRYKTEHFLIYKVLRRSSLSLTHSKSVGLKLPQLLSQFLYQTRKLDLPGIGSFTLDPTAVIPQEADRVGQTPATGIQFKNANILAPDDALINFIKEHTGKMKSLASSDLDFFLTTGKQLLNIGKPFYIEGIGTLVKTKDKGLEFTHGDYMIARLEDSSPERRVSYDEPAKDREQPKSNSSRQIMLLALIVLGLVVIGWGGYYLYRRNNFTEPSTEKQAVVIPENTARTDSNAVSSHPATDT